MCLLKKDVPFFWDEVAQRFVYADELLVLYELDAKFCVSWRVTSSL
jgi:hypothetical protein